MKRIEREYTHVEKKVFFEAWDGEIFSDEKQCYEYENNARGVIGKKVQRFRVVQTNEETLFYPFGVGGDEYLVEVFRPTCEKDIEDLNYYFAMFDKDLALIDNSYIGKDVIVNYNYDKDWLRFRTLDEYIKEFTDNYRKRVLQEGNDEEDNVSL